MSQVGLEFYDSVIDNETAWKIRLSYYHASAFADEVSVCTQAQQGLTTLFDLLPLMNGRALIPIAVPAFVRHGLEDVRDAAG